MEGRRVPDDAERGEVFGEGIVQVPVSRSRALTRGALWLALGLTLWLVTTFIYSGLSFRPSGVSNRLVDISIAIATLPVPLAGAYSGVRADLWLLLFLWPGPIGIVGDARSLTLRFGPFSTRVYDTLRIKVQYAFELSEESTAGSFEALLPPEEQMARLLPRIVHPDAREPLDEVILRFVGGEEAEVAAALRPVIELWRTYTDGDADGRE